ncbi:hypothetical protein [Glutamicibacter protophormiae]|nr:hypothetical protein GCM10010038_14650 [Glutamicibacter protophormiae]
MRPPPAEDPSERKFQYHGVTYDVLRFNPNVNATTVFYSPFKQVSATLPILGANVCLEAKATKRAQGLVYVLANDDTGELFGIWCFAEDIVYHD